MSEAVRRRGWLLRLLLRAWTFFVGVILCLNPVSSILAVGWLLRLESRSVLRRWARRAGVTGRHGFEDFAASHPHTARLAGLPNWLLHECPASAGTTTASSVPGPLKRLGRRLFGALADNVRHGVLSLANIWLLTLPSCVLWLLAWWGGWENSFNKGYEQHWVGPTIFLVAAGLFAVVMTYLPLALARQAATGQWRAFHDYRLVRTLIRTRWLSCLGLALAYVLAAFPVMALKMLPMRFDALVGDIADIGVDEFKGAVELYYFIATAALFALLILLRTLTARLYADALLSAVQQGKIDTRQLAPRESSILTTLDLLELKPKAPGHPFIRAIRWLGTRTARVTGLGLTLLLWAFFVFQLVFAQFLNHVWLGWLSHPLIHLPWLFQGPSP